MSDRSTIEWTDATWNPVTGCTKVSPGCDNCYAETLAERFRGTPGHYFEHGFDVQLRPDKLTQPLRWKRPRRIFVNSMSDLFHKDVPDEFICRVFAVMAATRHHTYQILTKRPARMRALMNSEAFATAALDLSMTDEIKPVRHGELPHGDTWPLPNVWLGVSVEDQKRADLRIPVLLETTAEVLFLSCEPLLGPVDLRSCMTPWEQNAIDWVIAGGESGRSARPMHPDWVRSLRDQCQAVGTAFHFKQWGEWAPESHVATARGAAGALYIERNGTTRSAARGARGEAVTVQRNGKHHTGRLLDGRTHDAFPERAA